jgi:hypothetical protein
MAEAITPITNRAVPQRLRPTPLVNWLAMNSRRARSRVSACSSAADWARPTVVQLLAQRPVHGRLFVVEALNRALKDVHTLLHGRHPPTLHLHGDRRLAAEGSTAVDRLAAGRHLWAARRASRTSRTTSPRPPTQRLRRSPSPKNFAVHGSNAATINSGLLIPLQGDSAVGRRSTCGAPRRNVVTRPATSPGWAQPGPQRPGAPPNRLRRATSCPPWR